MALPEKNMPEGSGPGLEAVSTGPSVGPAQTAKPGFSADIVKANTLLSDQERLQVVRGVLRTQLTPNQEQAVLKAHQVGAGEPGKEEGEAGIYNYTQRQISEKARILKEANFDKGQRRSLMESGLTGVLARDAAEDINPEHFHLKLRKIAKQFQKVVRDGNASDDVIKDFMRRLGDVIDRDDGDIPEEQQEELLSLLAGRLNIAAKRPDEPDLSIDRLNADGEAMKSILQPETREDQLEVERVFYFVRDDIRRVYAEAMQAPPQVIDEWYSPQVTPKTLDERMEAVNKALGIDPKTGKYNYEEIFWGYGEETLKRIFGESVNIADLERKFQGKASYIAARAAIAITKELRGLSLRPNSADSAKQEFGDYYLANIKQEIENTKGEREKDRREKRKRATARERLHYSSYRDRFDFTWAETPEELDDSIEDWLELFQQILTEEAEESVYNKVQKWEADAQSSFEQARIRIGLEADDPRAAALREKIKGHEKTIAGARLVESKGGLEYFLKLRKDEAAKYDPYYDGIYLREGFAIMADAISENAGEIYKSGDEDTHKPLDGDTRAYRGELERKIIEYGATHQLYITKDDFEAAELGEREIVKEVVRYNLSLGEGQRLIRQRLAERRKIKELNGKIDFETAELDQKDIEQAVDKLNLSEEDKQRMIAYRLGERRRARDMAGRYSWEDGIEELLLVDSRGLAKAQAMPLAQRAEAIERIKARTGFFKGIKDLLDKEDGLFGKTPEERRNIIRQRIISKIAQTGKAALLQEIAALPDQASRDRALWKRVEQYNKAKLAVHNEDSNDGAWFPSLWDEERLSINMPEDLVDRALTKKQFRAMVEKIEDPYEGLTDQQIERRVENDFRRQAQREIAAKRVSSQEAAQAFDKLMEQRRGDIKDKIENVLFERKQRETKVRRNFFLNLAQDKFEEFSSRWGGLTSREIDPETGDIRFTTIYAEAEKILKAKIDLEAKQVENDVNEWRIGFVATHPGLTAAEINQKEQEYKDALVTDNPGLSAIEIEDEVRMWKNGWESHWENEWKLGYVAIHPTLTAQELAAAEDRQRLRFEGEYKKETPQQINQRVEQWRLGYIATHPGLSPQQFDQIFKAAKEEMITKQRRLFRRHCTFAATLGLRELGLANDLPIWNYFYYGDESRIGAFAPLVGYTDDDKGELPALLDRGRREMEAVFYYLGQKHMDGKILEVVDRDSGLVVKDKKGKRKKAHEERWVRRRVINAGGVLKLRKIFENMFMISTSGGVEVVPLAARLGNLGVWDQAWENGAKDKREWQGFRKRRCKWEYRKQSFFNTREWADPLTHVDRVVGAAQAQKFLTGGQVEGQGHVPGILIEPMSGAYKYRDMFFNPETWLKKNTADLVMQAFQGTKKEHDSYVAIIQAVLNKEDARNHLNQIQRDKLVEIGAGILKPLMDYMDHRRYLMNRAGLAPKNWKYDNELIANAYFKELFDEETMGDENLDYARQGRNPLAKEIFEGILRTSSYHILVEKDKKSMYQEAEQVRESMDEKRKELMGEVLSGADLVMFTATNKQIADADKNIQTFERNLIQLKALKNDREITQTETKLKKETDARKIAEKELIEKTVQNVEAELERQHNAGNLSNELLRKTLINRRKKLIALHTSEINVTKEIYRLINDAIDMRLHMEFVGEWPARLLVA